MFQTSAVILNFANILLQVLTLSIKEQKTGNAHSQPTRRQLVLRDCGVLRHDFGHLYKTPVTHVCNGLTARYPCDTLEPNCARMPSVTGS